jgi:1-acylglycerone phosphate reductase
VYASARSLDKLSSLGSEIHKLVLDITNQQSIDEAVQSIIETHGRIDILVNNAGVHCVGSILDVPTKAFAQTMDVNFFGVLRLVKAVIPHMTGPSEAKQQGLIVNVGSPAGHIASPWAAAYSASKAAVHSLTDTLDMELRPLGIKVILVVPGAIKSNVAFNGGVYPPSPESPYAPYQENIATRLQRSQAGDAWPAERAAKVVVDAALKPEPPKYLTFAPFSMTTWILSWFSRTVVLNLMWKQLSKVAAPVGRMEDAKMK